MRLENLLGNSQYVRPSSPQPHPMALAMEWVAKITTVGLEMVLPGIGGHYLDAWLGTSFLSLLGFGVGLVVGMWHLLQMTKPRRRPPGEEKNRISEDDSGESSRQ